MIRKRIKGTLRRIQAINNTKIQYISVADKIYKVTNIDFCNQTIETKETDLTICDVPESELWDILYFEDFHVRLINQKGGAKIVNMAEWIENHGL